jgi:hypothetical protein
VKGDGQGVSRYYTRSKIIYLWYGFFSFLFTAAFMLAMSFFWFYFISERAGPAVAIFVVVLLLGRIIYRRVQRWLEKRQAETGEDARESEPAEAPASAAR